MVFRREALLVGAGVAILFDALLVWQRVAENAGTQGQTFLPLKPLYP